MDEIIQPLDAILESISQLRVASHVARKSGSTEQLYDDILAQINLAKNNIIKHLFSSLQLATNITQSQSNVQNIQANVSITESIKQVDNSSSKNAFSNEANHKLIIPTGNASKPNKETSISIERNVKNILKNSNTYATITNINPTNKGNIVFQFDKKDNINNISQQLKNELGQDIKLIEPTLPKLTVHNLPDTLDCTNKDEVIKNIIDGNPFIKDSMMSSHKKFDLLFTFSNKGSNHAVIKCSPDIRNLIISKNWRIRVDMSVCKVSDRIHIPRCTNCQKYNHTLKNCTETSATCTFCSQKHKKDNCPVKDDLTQHVCSNCNLSKSSEIKNQSKTHSAFSKECPIYKYHVAQLIKKTNWEGSPPNIE